MSIASDLDNRDFVGATNPDDQLSVQFYVKAQPNAFATGEAGRPIFEDVTFVKIFTPGNALNIIDTPSREEHRMRFPRQWAHFQNTHGEDSRVIGTPLASWPLLTPSQIEELRALKFFTVEQVAGASDAAIDRIGMLAGMSPYTFRDRAKNFLDVARGEADVSHRDAEIAALKASNAALQEQMSEFMEEMRKPKRGRPAASDTEKEAA